MQGTKRVADHPRSHSQEVAELGSKPTLHFSHCIAHFLQSHFPASLLALVCEQLHLFHKNPEEEGEEPITEVRAGGQLWSS